MDLNKKIEETLKICPQTKVFIIDRKAGVHIPQVLEEHYAGQKNVLVIGDEITMKIAGDAIAADLREKGFNVSIYLFTRDENKVDWDYIHEIENLETQLDAVPVMVGSGYLNDLTKLASHRQGRKYICFPTVGSVDGYCSFGAAVKTDGNKITVNCDAPYAVVADTEVLAAAPKFLTAAGYGDLAAKVPAGGEWMIADLFGTEPIHEAAWNCFYDILPELLGDPEGVAAGNFDSIKNLFAGLTLSGIAMQVAESSRPASCCDHLFSHALDMTHHTFNGRPQLHGAQVAIGTLTMCAVFDELFKYDLTKIDVDKCVEAWPSLEEVQQVAVDTFADFPVKDLGLEMMTKKYEPKEKVRKELEDVKACWPELKAKLQAQVWPFAKMQEAFAKVGAPTDPSQIGVTRAHLKSLMPKAAQMRWRINVFDLMKRCMIYDEVVESIFAKGGVWDLSEEKLK